MQSRSHSWRRRESGLVIPREQMSMRGEVLFELIDVRTGERTYKRTHIS